jgi:transposase InsO family protein/predicted aspartyl protease
MLHHTYYINRSPPLSHTPTRVPENWPTTSGAFRLAGPYGVVVRYKSGVYLMFVLRGRNVIDRFRITTGLLLLRGLNACDLRGALEMDLCGVWNLRGPPSRAFGGVLIRKVLLESRLNYHVRDYENIAREMYLLYKRTFVGGIVHHRDELTDFLGFTRTMENNTSDVTIEAQRRVTFKPFDGLGTMSVDEFFARFEMLCEARGWLSADEKANNLIQLTTGKPFELLSRVPIFAADAGIDRFALLKAELKEAYGLSMEKAITLVRNRQFRSEESIFDFASDLRRYVEAMLPDLSQQDRSRVAAIFFWPGLKQTEAIRHLFGAWKLRPDKSLEDAITMTRDCAEAEHATAFYAHSYKATHSARPNYKGKGKGKGVYRPIQKDNREHTQKEQQKCYNCGGYGHHASQCPSDNRRPKGTVCQNFFPLVFESNKYLCLLDTGCSRTLIYSVGMEISEDMMKETDTIIMSAKGCIVSNISYSTLTIDGVELNTVPIITDELVVRGKRVNVLLGLDWIKLRGPIVIGFRQNDEPYWTPLSHSFVGSSISRCEQGSQTDESDIVFESMEVTDDHSVDKRLEFKDFIARRLIKDDRAYWEVEWKWIEGVPPKPFVAVPNYGLDRHSAEAQAGFQKECQLWMDEGFVEPVQAVDCKATIPLICVEQPQKPSTPIRPVGDYQRLNKLIKSFPHEDENFPMSANLMLLVWRSMDVPLNELLLVDIRKAYMKIRIKHEQTFYQCMRFTWLPHQYYRMTRLGFGLNIAVKALRVILNAILEEAGLGNGQIVPYVDDMLCPRHLLPRLEQALASNDFAIKPAEELLMTKALGLKLTAHGSWGRRDVFPTLGERTRRGIHQWCGKITAHYPTCGWLRPACSALKRLTTLKVGDKTPAWDDPLDAFVEQALEKFLADIRHYGDTVKGVWQFNKNLPWILYTDASKYALGCLLKIGNVTVLDGTWLRKFRDLRQINIAELEAVIKGIAEVCKVKRALGIRNTLELRLMCDNKSVVAWLQRKCNRHWCAAKGDTSEAIEGRLQLLEDTIEAAKVNLDVQYVPSEENLADLLSRIPEYLIPPKTAVTGLSDESCDFVLYNTTEEVRRDPSGRVMMDPSDPRVTQLLTELHEHEGAHALFERIRHLISVSGLRKLCRDFVSACPNCQLAKVTRNAEVGLDVAVLPNTSPGANPQPLQPADAAWRVVHMDFAGPYKTDTLFNELFICSLVDRFSGYTLVECTVRPPSTATAIRLFRRVLNDFNAVPEIVHTDNGSTFVSAEWFAFLKSIHCRHVRSPVGASWCNGQVERVHRLIREHLAASGDVAEMQKLFFTQVYKVIRNYNTSVGRKGCSPHDLIFAYPAWIHPKIPPYLRPTSASVPIADSPVEGGRVGVGARAEETQPKFRLPEKGEVWLVRRAALGERGLLKLSRPYVPARVLSVKSLKCYEMVFPNKKTKLVHLKFMKRVPKALESSLKPEEIPPPLEEGGMWSAAPTSIRIIRKR